MNTCSKTISIKLLQDITGFFLCKGGSASSGLEIPMNILL